MPSPARDPGTTGHLRRTRQPRLALSPAVSPGCPVKLTFPFMHILYHFSLTTCHSAIHLENCHSSFRFSPTRAPSLITLCAELELARRLDGVAPYPYTQAAARCTRKRLLGILRCTRIRRKQIKNTIIGRAVWFLIHSLNRTLNRTLRTVYHCHKIIPAINAPLGIRKSPFTATRNDVASASAKSINCHYCHYLRDCIFDNTSLRLVSRRQQTALDNKRAAFASRKKLSRFRGLRAETGQRPPPDP